MNKKGWHQDYTRHSEARLYGRASGSKLKPKTLNHSTRDAQMFHEIDKTSRVKTRTKLYEIAETEITPREKALFYKKELIKEVKKKSPDPQALEYYKKEFVYWRAKTGQTYFYPETRSG